MRFSTIVKAQNKTFGRFRLRMLAAPRCHMCHRRHPTPHLKRREPDETSCFSSACDISTLLVESRISTTAPPSHNWTFEPDGPIEVYDRRDRHAPDSGRIRSLFANNRVSSGPKFGIALKDRRAQASIPEVFSGHQLPRRRVSKRPYSPVDWLAILYLRQARGMLGAYFDHF